ncbi:Cytochrome P450 71C2 [Hordeum vulgare]|nr:Cytochrome P450 71C2 [Hordeum vulgare]
MEVPHADAALLVLLASILLLMARRRFGLGNAAARAREEALNKLPSPGWRLPVIGHLHQVGPLPHVSLRHLAAEHGRDGLMLVRLGAVPTLVVSTPAAAQAVLRTHDHVFASRPHSPVAHILFYGSADVVFAPYGHHWRQVKKISTTHLLTARKVHSYRHARQHEVNLVLAKVRDAMRAGVALDMTELLNAFVFDIVCHAVAGNSFRERGLNKHFRELVEANASLIGGFNLEDHFPALVKLEIFRKIVCAKARRVNNKWDDLLDRLIDEHATPPALDEDRDFIHVLLSVQQEYNLTRDHIKAQLLIMFEAGTDTSTIVLEYAMVRLMQNPRVMAMLQAEVRSTIPKGKDTVTQEDLHGLPYLKAVIKETLRLHMPGPLMVPHLSMDECIINGYTIPSGTRTFINTYAIQRDPTNWESPEEFMPERFMEGGSAAAMDYKGNDFQYFPFGSGRRICPGINFATATIQLMLTNLMYHFDWKLPPESAEEGINMTETFGLTVHRKEKLLLVPLVPQN